MISADTISENDLQSAIVCALQVYAAVQQVTIQSSWKYSNQQGGDLRKLCADFITTLNHSSIFLAEVKVQHKGTLKQFNASQFKSNLAFEQYGYPIFYVYNTNDSHPYWHNPQPKSWYKSTLQSANYSPPSKLPGIQPDIDSHGNLLGWLESASSGQERTEQLAQIFARIRANELNNAILMLVYGSENMNLFEDLDATSITALVRTLKTGSRKKFLQEKEQKILDRFLKREAEFFRLWHNPSLGLS